MLKGLRLTGLLALLFSFFAITANAATKTATITGATTWAALTWSPAGAPVSGDDVIINFNGSGSYALSSITSVPSSGSFASVTIQGTNTAGTLTLSGSTGTIFTARIVINNRVTFAGVSPSGLTGASSVATGKILTISTGTTATTNSIFTIGTGGVFTINGTVNCLGNNLLSTASTRIVVASGGVIDYNGSSIANTQQAMTINSGGTVYMRGTGSTFTLSSLALISGTLVIGGTATIGTGGTSPTYNSGSTLEYARTAGITASAKEWPATNGPTNVRLNFSTTSLILTLGTSMSRTIPGVLTMTQGKFAIGAGNTLTLNGTMSGTTSASNGNFIGSATSNLTIGGSGAFGSSIFLSQTNTTEASLLNLIIDRGPTGTVTFGNAHRIVTGGTYQLLDGTVTVSGTLTFVGTVTVTRVAGSMSAAPTFGTTTHMIYGDGTTAGNITTGPELPTANTIGNFTVNLPSANILTLNTSTDPDVTAILTMTSGNVNLNSNTLTLGTNASTPGTYTYTAGLMYGGTFKRWFTTTSMSSSLPSSTATAPDFPMGTSALASRKVWVARSAAFSAGGSLSVTANNVAGVTPICPSFTDASVDVNQRSNSNWVVTGTGFAGSSATISYEMEQGTSTFTTTTPANLRLVESAGIADGANGTVSVTASTTQPRVRRTGVPLASYAATNTYYIGGNKPNIAGTATSISSAASGAWNTPGTWAGGVVPTSSDNVTILTGHSITVNSGSSSADDVTVNSGGTLTIGGGTLTLGSTCGGASTFTNNGTFTISSGTLNVGGNAQIAGTFNMSGGTINIDGNDGTSGGSVAAATPLLNIASNTMAVTGGAINILDPHFTATTSNGYALNVTGLSTVDEWTGNTLTLGGGTNTSTAPNGFKLNTYNASTTTHLIISNLIIDGGDLANNRHAEVLSTNRLNIGGNLTIQTGSEFYGNGSAQINTAGNVTNDGVFETVLGVTWGLRKSSVSGFEATAAQAIGGSGTYTIGGALVVDNTNAGGGVTLGVPLTIGGTLTLDGGRVFLGNNDFTMTEYNLAISGTPSASAMFVTNGTGQFKRYLHTSVSVPILFPIGDNTGTAEYSPVVLDFSSGSNSGIRTIGARVTDANHPNLNVGFTPVDYLSRYWVFTDNSAAALSYGGYLGYVDADVNGSSESSIKMQNYTGAWADVPNTGISTSLNRLTFSSATFNLNNAEITGRATGITPPSNDDCPGTTLTVGSAATSGTVLGATQTVADNYGGYDDDDVWYNFTATATSALITLSQDVNPLPFDGVLELRDNSACNSVRIQARNFSTNVTSLYERIRVSGLTIGQNYKIRIYSYDTGSANQGGFTIRVENTYTPTANDNVCSATTYTTLGNTVTANTNTSYGFEIGEPTGANWGFDIDNHPSVPSNSQWYKFTPTTTSTYTITGSMVVGNTGLQMGVYRSNTGTPVCGDILIPANRVEVGSGYTSAMNGTVNLTSLCLTAGVDYYIQLDSDLGQLNTPRLTITNTGTPLTTPTANAATSVSCTGFTANWGTVVGATSYEIDVATDLAFTNIIVNAANAGTGTSYGVSGLATGNNFYYRIRAIGTCTQSANSNIISVIVLPAAVTATGNSSTGPVTLCSGAAFDLDATGGAGATSWSWSGPSYTNANQNPASFNATNGGTYTVTASNTCGNATDGVVLNLNPLPSLPNGLANQEICGAGNVTFTVTDPGSPLVNQWSTDGVNHNGGTGLTYSVALSSGQTTPMYARTFNTTTNCYSAWAQADGISHPNPVVTPTNSGPVCFNDPVTFTGPAGMASYTWTGPNGFASGVQNPTLANASFADVGTYTLTVVDGNTCTGSGTTTLAVGTCGTVIWTGAINQDWNTGGNWSGGFVPTVVNNVLIPDVGANDPILSTGIDGGVKNLTINAGVPIIIGAGKKIVVKGNWLGNNNPISGSGALEFSGSAAQTITGGGQFSNININNANGVTIPSYVLNLVKITEGLNLINGTFTGNGLIYLVSTSTQTAYINNFTTGYTGTINGTITMERSNTGPTGFRYLSMPVNNANISEISEVGLIGTNMGQVIPLPSCSPVSVAQNSAYGNVMEWHEDGPFIYAGCRQSGWYVRSSGTLENFRGYLVRMYQNTGVVVTGTPNLTAQTYANLLYNSNPTGDGWQLMGNPYPSPVQWTGVAGFGDLNLFSTSGIYTGTYASFAPVQNKIIASMQGFFVRRLSPSGASFSLPNASRRALSNIIYQDLSGNWYDHLLEIDITGNGYGDHSTLYFNSGATAGYEAYYDARKMDGRLDQPTIYTHLPNGGEQLGVNGLDSLNQTYVVPLVMKPGQNGEFTLNFAEVATFPQSAMIYLEDLQTGTLTDLRANPSYVFTSDVNDNPERFLIRFEPPVAATIADETCETEGSIVVTQPGTTVWSAYELRDNANNIYAQGNNLNGTTTFSGLHPREYILTLTHPTGYVAQEYYTVNGVSAVNAAMAVSANNVAVNQPVNFTATTNATGVVWNFGDGNQQVGANVTHSYAAAGTYNVTLTASNNNCDNVASGVITVNQATGIDNTTAETLTVNGYGEQLVVEFNNWGGNKADIFVYNALGQRVETFTGVSTVTGRQMLNVSNVVPGYYFIQVVSNGKVQGQKVYLGTN